VLPKPLAKPVTSTGEIPMPLRPDVTIASRKRILLFLRTIWLWIQTGQYVLFISLKNAALDPVWIPDSGLPGFVKGDMMPPFSIRRPVSAGGLRFSGVVA
jgi:hypothetical protein